MSISTPFPFPGRATSVPQRALGYAPTEMMATDAMRSLSFRALCDVIEAHIEAMPADQIDPALLDRLANKLGRAAHMAARERA